MKAKDTVIVEEIKECLAKWFDRAREWGDHPISKKMLAELEANGERLAEISFDAGLREAIEWVIEFFKDYDALGYDRFCSKYKLSHKATLNMPLYEMVRQAKPNEWEIE